MKSLPIRGDIWLVKLDPTLGSEIKKTRPCLIISNTRHNQVASIVTVLPITSGKVQYASFQIEVPRLSQLKNESYLEIPQIRVADKRRLLKKVGAIPEELFQELFIKLNFYLGFTEYLK